MAPFRSRTAASRDLELPNEDFVHITNADDRPIFIRERRLQHRLLVPLQFGLGRVQPRNRRIQPDQLRFDRRHDTPLLGEGGICKR